MASALGSRALLTPSCVATPRRGGAGKVSRKVQLKAAQTLTTVETKKSKKAEKKEEEDEEFEAPGLTPGQVASLLSVMCDETEIAEVELKMDSFKLKVRRKLGATAAAAPVAAAPVAAAPAPVAAAPAAAPATTPVASATLDEEDLREALVSVFSPKVGVMRTGRYVKGKQVGKGPLVAEGDKVKAGQAIYFVEQLGTHVAVEAPQAGEVVELLKADGDPVEYGEEVALISPYFGGHIIGDAKLK